MPLASTPMLLPAFTSWRQSTLPSAPWYCKVRTRSGPIEGRKGALESISRLSCAQVQRCLSLKLKLVFLFSTQRKFSQTTSVIRKQKTTVTSCKAESESKDRARPNREGHLCSARSLATLSPRARHGLATGSRSSPKARPRRLFRRCKSRGRRSAT